MIKLAALALACSLTSLTLAQDVANIAVVQGQQIPGAPGPVLNPGNARFGVDQGWAASCTLSLPNGGTQEAIIGVTGPDPTVAPTLLRLGQTLFGHEQQRILDPTLFGGQLYYRSRDLNAPGQGWAVWRDGQLLLRTGDVLGSNSYRFWAFNIVEVLTNGEVLIDGFREDLNGVNLGRAVLRYPSMTLVRTRDMVLDPAFGALNSFEFRMSPNGLHTATESDLFGNDSTLYVDGSVFTFPGGTLARAGAPVPAAIAGAPFVSWSGFNVLDVNDEGDVLYRAGYQMGSDHYSLVMRNDRVVDGPFLGTFLPLGGLDPAGWALIASNDKTHVDGVRLLPPSARLDADFDGVQDPEWQIPSLNPEYVFAVGARSEAMISVQVLNTQTAAMPTALVMVTPYAQGSSYCTATPNSSGLDARIIAQRSNVVATQDLRLQCKDLPTGVFGYFLASRTSGFAPTPGGSQGNLCLGGSIARLNTQVFQTGLEGRGDAIVDLSAMPLPTGSAPALPGETWNFQAWFRDTVGGQSTSNFTDAVAVPLL